MKPSSLLAPRKRDCATIKEGDMGQRREERDPLRRRRSLAVELEGAGGNDVGFERDISGATPGRRRAVRATVAEP